MSLLAQIRFGYGASASASAAVSTDGQDFTPDGLLAQLEIPDPATERFARPGSAERRALLVLHNEQIRQYREMGDAADDAMLTAGGELKTIFAADKLAFVLRPVAARNGFAERLANLWANRLTVGMVGNGGTFIQPFRDEVARAHMAGRFADMLRASIWHPAMHIYLNQNNSIGPNSNLGKRKGRGLNENLAREFLELHAMGGEGYTQADVTELARLMAGMQNKDGQPQVRELTAEPGPKTILGQVFGDDDPVAEIDRFVALVATRPETARSVALTLARHFISDTPPADLVDTLAAVYLREDSALPPVYRALAEHPAARNPTLEKLRSPQEYAAACLRALGLTGEETGLPGQPKNGGFRLPEAMQRMGQRIFAPRQPDGWPETADGWLTPPMMAARIDFGVDIARAGGERTSPLDVADLVLGDLASPTLRRAVQGAEQRWEGVAVLLASPEFMRR